MVKFSTAAEWIEGNPSKTLAEISKLSGLNIRTIQRANAVIKLKKTPDGEIKIDTVSPDVSASTTFIQNGENAEYSFKTGSQIKSLSDLVKACDIDLDQWVIERFICNKWEVGAKDKNNEIKVTPLFQVKVWLKPHVKQQTEILSIIRGIVEDNKAYVVKFPKPDKLKNKKALKVTLTDMHVGLDPYVDGKSIFNYIYNERIFNENLDKVFNSILGQYNNNGKFDVVFIDDLGDGLDGWNGQTTRGGHGLDQNMNNTESFRVYVTGKLRLIERVIQANVANRVEIKSVSNCNHSGSFGYIANYSIGLILSRSYDEKFVKNIILEKFMEHFEYGDHTFILTHGKDAKYMFKGLPLELNPNATKFINSYIDHYKITSKYIHVVKGDLHRVGYNKTKKFDYRNYMSFAPPSVWQQHNFDDAYAGYAIDIIPFDNNEVSHMDYFFELECA